MTDYFTKHGEAETTRNLTKANTMKRLGQNDVACAILYLASNEIRLVAGAVFKMDGGISAA